MKMPKAINPYIIWVTVLSVIVLAIWYNIFLQSNIVGFNNIEVVYLVLWMVWIVAIISMITIIPFIWRWKNIRKTAIFLRKYNKKKKVSFGKDFPKKIVYYMIMLIPLWIALRKVIFRPETLTQENEFIIFWVICAIFVVIIFRFVQLYNKWRRRCIVFSKDWFFYFWTVYPFTKNAKLKKIYFDKIKSNLSLVYEQYSRTQTIEIIVPKKWFHNIADIFNMWWIKNN